MRVKFEASIEIRGINPFVLVSADRADGVRRGWRKPMPVLVRLNDKPADPHRINMIPVGDGGFFLYLNGIVRRETGVGVGDVVQVEIEFDDGYRGGPLSAMPDWFAEALAANPVAEENWARLTPSRQKEGCVIWPTSSHRRRVNAMSSGR